jgi:hypothetical protein
MAITDSTALAWRRGLPAAPGAGPLPQPHAAITPQARAAASLGGSGLDGAPLVRGAGFAIHQLLAARPELRGPPADLRQTIGAYRAHLASRIHYSGPVRPVDLRV